MKDARDLAKKIGAQTPGETVKLGVLRKGSEQSVTVTLGTIPNDREARADRGQRRGGDRGDTNPDSGVPQLGLSLAPAGSVAGAGASGVIVTDVDSNGPAAERGFKTGDVILEVAGKQVANPADVRKALNDARTDGKRTVLLRVKSGDATRFVALPVARG